MIDPRKGSRLSELLAATISLGKIDGAIDEALVTCKPTFTTRLIS